MPTRKWPVSKPNWSPSAKRQMSDSRDRLAGMEDLNRRTVWSTLETGRQAENHRMQSEQAPTIDNSNADKVKRH